MPELDDKQRLLEYLRQQQERRARQDDPSYRKSVNADLMGAQNVATGNNLAALLMDSASMAGTMGGKRADASGVARFAAAQNDALGDFRRGMAGEEAARENRYQMDAKVREYLAAKQQAGEDRAATAKYRADTLAQNAAAAKAREAGERARFGATQGLEREKMAQAAALKEKEIAANAAKGDERPITEGERRMALFSKITTDELPRFEEMETKYRPGKRAAVANMLPSSMANYAMSDEDRAYDSAARRILDPLLRSTTGANAPQSEIDNMRAAYIVLPGDDEKTIQQKQQARRQFIEGIIAAGGKATRGMTVPTGPIAAPAQPGQAVAAPASAAPKPAADMTDDELDAELARLKGGKP